MSDSQILKGMRMKRKIENMAHEKLEKSKKQEDEDLAKLSKEERRKILLERLHKKTKRLNEEDKFKELSTSLQNANQKAQLENSEMNKSISEDEIKKRANAKKRKIKKIKSTIKRRQPIITEEMYLESLKQLEGKSLDDYDMLYNKCIIDLYEKQRKINVSNGIEDKEDDLEFD